MKNEKEYLHVVQTLVVLILVSLTLAMVYTISGTTHVETSHLKDYPLLLYIALAIFAAYISMLFVLSNLNTAHKMPIYQLCVEHYGIQYYIVLLLISIVYLFAAKQLYLSAIAYYISSILIVLHIYIFCYILEGIIEISLSYSKYRKVMLDQIGKTFVNLDKRYHACNRLVKDIESLETKYTHFDSILFVYGRLSEIKRYCSSKEYSVNPAILHKVMVGILRDTERLCEENDLRLVRYATPDRKVGKGKPIFGLYSKNEANVPNELDDIIRKYSHTLETKYDTVNDEYENATYSIINAIYETIREGNREKVVRIINTVVDTYWYALNPYIEEKLAAEIRNILIGAIEDNRFRIVRDIIYKNVMVLLREALNDSKTKLYRVVMRDIATILNVKDYNEATKALYRGYTDIMKNDLAHECRDELTTKFHVQNIIGHINTLVLNSIINNRKNYGNLLKEVVRENTAEYSFQKRGIVIEKVFKYALLALARAISQQLSQPNDSEYEENIAYIIDIYINGIVTQPSYGVETALDVIEANAKDWTWDIEQGMKSIDSGEIIRDTKIDVECLIGALSIIINTGIISNDYNVTREHSIISEALQRGSFERVTSCLDEKARNIAQKLSQKIEIAPGKRYQAKSRGEPISYRIARQALNVLDRLQDANKQTLRNSRPPITVYLAETDEAVITYKKRYPRAAFQSSQYNNYYHKYENIIARDIYRYIWQVVIAKYHSIGKEVDLRAMLSSPHPIMGFNTKEYQRKLLARRNGRDAFEYDDGEWKIDVISNLSNYIYGIEVNKDTLIIGNISYEMAREEISKRGEEFFMYGEIDFSEMEIVQSLVLELSVEISIDIILGGMLYHRKIGNAEEKMHSKA